MPAARLSKAPRMWAKCFATADDNGNIIEEQLVEYGEDAKSIEAPVKNGYKFLHWVVAGTEIVISAQKTEQNY